MLRITHSQNGSAAVAYFDVALSHGDYYAAEAAGQWHGIAAARLGLSGTVGRTAFATVMANVNPVTGERLTARMRDDRRPGTDFTFNAPKGVSLLAALSGDERITAAFRLAVINTMREVERDAKTRVRQNGRNEDRLTGNLAWAEFLHTTTRPVNGVPDPHLHIHAFIPNVTWDKTEQRFKALQLGDIVADRAYYEAAFLARLAHAMKDLGFEIARKGKYWDIGGLSDDLLKQYSRRAAEIEQAAIDQGITSPHLKDQLGKRTRQRKTRELTPGQCLDLWRQRLDATGRTGFDGVLQRAQSGTRPAADINDRQAVDYAVGNALERASVALEKDIFSDALRRGFGDVLPETVRAAAERVEFIRGTIDGRKVVTTKAVLAEEMRLIDLARHSRASCPPLAPTSDPAAGFLNDGQQTAVRHVWQSPDRVTSPTAQNCRLSGASGASLPATFAEQFYVSVSRGRDSVRIFTDDAAAVRGAIARSGARGSASELIDGKITRKLTPLRDLPRPERIRAHVHLLNELAEAHDHGTEMER